MRVSHCPTNWWAFLLWTSLLHVAEDRRRWAAVAGKTSVGVPPTTFGRHGFWLMIIWLIVNVAFENNCYRKTFASRATNTATNASSPCHSTGYFVANCQTIVVRPRMSTRYTAHNFTKNHKQIKIPCKFRRRRQRWVNLPAVVIRATHRRRQEPMSDHESPLRKRLSEYTSSALSPRTPPVPKQSIYVEPLSL